MDFLDQQGLQSPVVQAGMGGGITTAELAGSVSLAGGLGTVGIMPVAAFDDALAKARFIAGNDRPLAANLLPRFTRKGHIAACIRHHVSVVTFLGETGKRWMQPLQAAGIPVHLTVGNAAQAAQALAAGADGLVVQGVEAGGHQVAVESIDAALPKVRDMAGYGVPVLAAGGVAERSDVSRLLAAGADAVIAGTRFLLTHESAAHPAYQQRVLTADHTLRTLLFGVGWPLAHRVVPNAATDYWCKKNDLGPTWARIVGRLSGPAGRLLPVSAQDSMAKLQRPYLGLFSPALPLRHLPESMVDRTALYAGESAHRITAIVTAKQALEELTP